MAGVCLPLPQLGVLHNKLIEKILEIVGLK